MHHRPVVQQLACFVDYRQEGGMGGIENLAAVVKIPAEVTEDLHCLCAFEKASGCGCSVVIDGSSSI
jgi:hypothetical protein